MATSIRVCRILMAGLMALGLTSCLGMNGNFNVSSEQFATVSCNYVNYDDVGAGADTDPYQLFCPAQLQSLADNPQAWGSSFVLVNDIDLTGVTLPSPIGNTAAFTGSFDGAGFTISNAQGVSDVDGDVGIFGNVSGTVENVQFDNLTINAASGSGNAGVIARNTGDVFSVQVTNASINGTGNVGAIIGLNEGFLESSTANTTSVTGSGNVGGLVGYLTGSGVVQECATGKSMKVVGSPVNGATSTQNVGGLVGLADTYASIGTSYALGSITLSPQQLTVANVGGLVGSMATENNYGVSNAYTTVSITVAEGVSGGSLQVGGLVGYLAQGEISTTYSAGNIQVQSASSSSNSVAGLVGEIALQSGSGNAVTVSQSFSAVSTIETATGNTPDVLIANDTGATTSALSYVSSVTCTPSCTDNRNADGYASSEFQSETNILGSGGPQLSVFTSTTWFFPTPAGFPQLQIQQLITSEGFNP